MYSDDHDLTEQERSALTALPRELAPSDLLEERVFRALRNEGHFASARHSRQSWSRTVGRIAAAIALFAGGVATGHYALSQPTASTSHAAATVGQSGARQTTTRASNGVQSVKHNETIVAEREMWL